MAIVNVDLSEYDSLRNRAKELEEQNKELKEQVKDLKSGSKVIIRVVEQDPPCHSTYHDFCGLDRPKRIISESYVGFEDVRLKVEEAMKDDINLSIDHRDAQADALEKERKYLKETMGKEYEERIKTLQEKIYSETKRFEDLYGEYEDAFKSIKKLTENVLLDLSGRFFKPNNAIKLVEDILSVACSRHAKSVTEDSGIKY